MGFSTSPLYPDSGTADALKINGTPVSGLKPANGQTLVYSSSIDEYVPQTPSGGGGGLPLSESSYIIAKPGDDLAAKYTAAKALTPNGAAKSATNRASLIIFPGSYTLSAELAIDAEFVDVIGLGAQTRTPAMLIAGNTLNVSANDVRVSGLSVGTQQFKITGNKPLQVFENCAGGASSFGGGALISTASGTFTDCSGGVDSFGGVGVASGIFANCRLTTGSFPTIYIPGKMRSCLDADYNVFDADGIYDPDASSYFSTAGVTDNTAKQQLHAFVLGIKQLGLWSSMVCWPLRSTQNAGTGSTAYSLGGLGTYNGTLVNGPTWGADGVTFSAASSQQISTNLSFVSYPLVAFAITKVTSIPVASSTSIIDSDTGLNPNRNWALGFQSFGGDQNSAYAFSTSSNNGLTPTYTLSANFDAHIYKLNSSTHALSKNGAEIASATHGLTLNTSAAPKVFIGSRSDGARGFNGPIALTGLISGTVIDSVFNELLKSTLGQGLGLP